MWWDTTPVGELHFSVGENIFPLEKLTFLCRNPSCCGEKAPLYAIKRISVLEHISYVTTLPVSETQLSFRVKLYTVRDIHLPVREHIILGGNTPFCKGTHYSMDEIHLPVGQFIFLWGKHICLCWNPSFYQEKQML